MAFRTLLGSFLREARVVKARELPLPTDPTALPLFTWSRSRASTSQSRFLSEKGLDALCKSASRLDRKTRRNGRYRIASATEAAQTQYLAPRKVAATFGTSSASSPQRLIYPVKNCPTIEQCLGHSVCSFKELAEKLRAGECHQDWTVKHHGVKMHFKDL